MLTPHSSRGFTRLGVVVLISLAPACGLLPSDPHSSLAIARSSDGGLLLHHPLCAGSHITAIEVSLWDGVSNEGGVVLWRIEQEEMTDRERFTIGQTPPDFVEVVAFQGELPDKIAVDVITDSIESVAGADLDDVPEEPLVYHESSVRPLPEFRNLATEMCPRRE